MKEERLPPANALNCPILRTLIGEEVTVVLRDGMKNNDELVLTGKLEYSKGYERAKVTTKWTHMAELTIEFHGDSVRSISANYDDESDDVYIIYLDPQEEN